MTAQGPTQWGPTQKRTRGECLQFFFLLSHEAAVWPSATVAKHMCAFSVRMSSSLLMCLILLVASVVKSPSMIRVTLLCGQVLSGWALWRWLRILGLGVGVKIRSSCMGILLPPGAMHELHNISNLTKIICQRWSEKSFEGWSGIFEEMFSPFPPSTKKMWENFMLRLEMDPHLLFCFVSELSTKAAFAKAALTLSKPERSKIGQKQVPGG